MRNNYKMFNYFVLLFIILLNTFFVSCNNDKKFNSEPIDIKKAFQIDQKKFVKVVKIFADNPILNSIVRRNAKKIIGLEKFSSSMDYQYSYLIRIDNHDIDIIIPLEYSENEYLFFEKDFSKIKGRYSDDFLGNFIKNYISENDLKEIIFFLIKYDLFSIFQRPNEDIIYIEEEYQKGIFFNPEKTNVLPDISPNAKIEKLKDHWYYYDDLK